MATSRKQEKTTTGDAPATQPLESPVEGQQSVLDPTSNAPASTPVTELAGDNINAGSGAGAEGESGMAGQLNPLQATAAEALDIAPPIGSAEASRLSAGNESEAADTYSTDPNPVLVTVYPLRSFIDDNELRRRGGPSYSVPRRHAQDLERRKLVSPEPLEE